MKLFRKKVWSPFALTCLKWYSLLVGMVVGAYFSEFVKRHVWLFLVLAVILAIVPFITYFNDKDVSR
jgi:FtsH-binding integral membrane protein